MQKKFYPPMKKRRAVKRSLPEKVKLRCESIIKRIPDITGKTKREHFKRMEGQKNVLFIWIPKTAGTSLVDSISATVYLDPKDLQRRFPGLGRVTFGHMSYTMLLERKLISADFFKNAFKFTVVRNPYDRAVSLYHYLINMKDIPSDMNFSEFCQFVSTRGCEPLGLYNFRGLSQCNPQVQWLEGIEIDQIIQFENLNHSFPALCENIGLDPKNVSLAQKNRSSRKDYPVYYDSVSKAIVEKLYAEDFQKLGYSHETFDPPLTPTK